MQLQPHPIEAERGKKRNGSAQGGKRGGGNEPRGEKGEGGRGCKSARAVEERICEGTVCGGERRQPFIIRQNAKRARHFNRNRFSPRKKVRI